MRKAIHFFQVIVILMLALSCSQQPGKDTEEQASIPAGEDDLLAAIDEVNSQIRSDSLNPDLYEQRARIYIDHQAWNEAFKDISTALELDSTY